MAAHGSLGQSNEFDDTAHAHLPQDIGAVEVHRLLADPEIERDVLVAPAGNQPIHDLFLPLCEKLDSRLDFLMFLVLTAGS